MRKLFFGLLLFLALIIPLYHANSCMNIIPHSEAVKAISLTANAGAITCAQLPDEACYCYEGIDWETAIIAEDEVDDPSKPLYGTKYRSTDYETLEACQAGVAAQELVYEDPECPGRLEDGIDPVTGNTGCWMHNESFCQSSAITAGYPLRSVCAEKIGGSYDGYCISVDPRSYEQMTVIRLREDATKAAAKAKLVKQRANLAAKNAYYAQRDATAQTAINVLLQGWDETTHLMLAMSYMDVSMNISGTNSQQDIDAAKAALVEYRTLMGQVQTLRTARDSDKASWTPPNTDVDPLYPAE